MERIYVDNNATTPLDLKVFQEMCTCLQSKWGNPSAIYKTGREARLLIDNARESVAKLLNAEVEEIIFTSGGTESNNLVFNNLLQKKSDNKKHILTSKVEHQAVLKPLKFLEHCGFKITYLDCDKHGNILPDDFNKKVTTDSVLLSLMLVNNDTGVIQELNEIAKCAHEMGVLVHSDCVQALAKIPIDVKKLNIDFLSISAHKIYGPKGIGALYKKKEISLSPLIRGGNQEQQFRAGTENTAAIHGFGIACDIANLVMENENIRINKIRDCFEQRINNVFPDAKIISENAKRVANTSYVIFPGNRGDLIALHLDLSGIEVSTGSACSSLSNEPSYVLKALGFNDDEANSSVRFSFGRNNSFEQVETIIESLQKVIRK
jgi:cysteine desulfurase